MKNIPRYELEGVTVQKDPPLHNVNRQSTRLKNLGREPKWLV